MLGTVRRLSAECFSSVATLTVEGNIVRIGTELFSESSSLMARGVFGREVSAKSAYSVSDAVKCRSSL
jgi:hypothetical protein